MHAIWPATRTCLPGQVCSNLAIRAPGGGSSAAGSSGRDLSVVLGRLVSSVILLRDVLRCLPAIAESMAWVDSTLLKVAAGP